MRIITHEGALAELAAQVVPKLGAAAHAVRARVEAEKHSVMPRQRKGSVVVEADATGIRVVNTDHGAHIDEYGSVNSPPYASLRRGTRRAGFRLEEHGK